MKDGRRRRVHGALFVLVATAGCSALTSLDGLSSGGMPIDGGGGGGGGDGGSEAATAPSGDGSVGDDAGQPAPRARQWRRVDVAGPSARHSVRMAYDETRKTTILVGGADVNTAKADAWEWDGTKWSRISSNGLSPQRAPGLVYDGDRKLVMLFGGPDSPSTPLEWNGGQQWTPALASSGPPPSYATGVAYDSARKVLVTFGGYRSTTKKTVDETWEWSASSGFTKRTLPRSPPARLGHAMVYDSDRARIVLFGGSGDAIRNDVWEYDGSTWTEQPTTLAPTPRVGACAAYDSVRRVTVVFGGRSSDSRTSLGDTFEWDGASWKPGPSGPPPRRACAMAFDKERNAIVMFGGSPGTLPDAGPPDSLGDTWVYE